MAQTIELPLCTQCGAAPRSRRQPSCPYCGAVLPWEVWDELSRHRIEVTRVEARRLESALAEAGEAGKTGARAVSPARRRLRRLRRLRRRSTRREEEFHPQDQAAMAVIVGVPLGLWFLHVQFQARPLVTGVGLIALVAAAFAWRNAVARRRSRVKAARRSVTRRAGDRRVRSAVVAVSAPELVPGTQSTWQRVVTLYTPGRRQVAVFAADGIDVAVGSLGVASLLGSTLVDFKLLGTVGAEVSVGPGNIPD